MFSSSANTLVSGDNHQLGLDVFLRDRASNTSTLVSVNCFGTGGANGNSTDGQVSTDGRYVVFKSNASDLIAGDTNGFSDIFVRDLQAGSNILISVAANGSFANGASTDPVMTPDGRFVSFVSAATNLVANDTNGISDVFVRDLLNGTTTLISVGATTAGASYSSPMISSDGRYVAFSTTAKSLVAGVPPSSTGEVYVRDLISHKTTWASSNAANIVNLALGVANTPSLHPVISSNGSRLYFRTGRTDGVKLSGKPGVDIFFQYNLTNSALTAISSNGFSYLVQGDDIFGPELSADGRFAAFVTTNSGCVTVELWDAMAGTNQLVSITMDGNLPTNSVSDMPVISSDGRFVFFESTATNLVSDSTAPGFHFYCRDLQNGITTLLEAGTNNVSLNSLPMASLTVSADGKLVTFSTLGDGSTNGSQADDFNVFVRDPENNTTELISARDPGSVPQTGDGWSFLGPSALGDDGRKLVFTSVADDLTPSDANGSLDVFLHDVIAGTNALVSADADGNAAAGSSFNPATALGGRLIAFISTATNLVAGRTNFYANVFLRDTVAGTNSMVSVAPDKISPGNGDSVAVTLSQNGRFAVFVSRASNLSVGASPSAANAYLRDFSNGTTTLLTNNASTTVAPSISSDGRFVVYSGSIGPQAVVRDNQWETNIFTANGAVASVVSLSGANLLLLTNNSKALLVVNLLNRSNLFTFPAGSAIKISSAPWSSDGRFFVFSTVTNADLLDTNGTSDVYLCDSSSNLLTLVSVDASHTSAGNGVSDSAVISGDGRFVAYRSYASNLVSESLNSSPNIFLYDRFTGSNTLLSAPAPSPGWTSLVAQPVINGDGSSVAFQSWRPAQATGDFNRSEDVLSGILPAWGEVDDDLDGIPDLWLTHYFGHATGLAGDLSRASDDADGDGLSNSEEFRAGTDPTNPSSNLRLQISAQAVSSANVQLDWKAVPGKHYRVQFKNTIGDPLWSDLSGATVVGFQGTFVLPTYQSSRFFRVIAE